MATKNNPGKYDCYTKAEPDEPMFVLLARDPAAPTAIRTWVEVRSRLGLIQPEKFEEALRCAADMETWFDKNRKAK